MTRQEYDAALDARKLYVAMNNGKWWLARRNGATRTWKRDPSRFYIPVKYGFRGYGHIDQSCDPAWFKVANSREEAEAA